MTLTAPITIAPSLAQLAAEFARLKAAEAMITDQRRAVAAQIQALTGHQVEGAKTYDGGDYKVVVKAPLIRSMDWAAWETVKAQIPAELWPVEMKPALDEKGVKWIQANDPQTAAILAQCLTIKPGAVSVTVTRKGE